MRKKILLLGTLTLSGILFSQSRLEIVEQFLNNDAISSKLIPTKIDYDVLNEHTTVHDLDYVKIQQKVNGIPVYQTFGTFSLKNKQVATFNQNFVSSYQEKLAIHPKRNATETFRNFATTTGKNFVVISTAQELLKRQKEIAQNLSNNDVVFIQDTPTKLVYFNDNGVLKLSWVGLLQISEATSVDEHKHSNAYEAVVDVETGKIYVKTPIITACNLSHTGTTQNVYKNNLEDYKWILDEYTSAATSATGSYRVIPANFESPNKHDFTLLNNVTDPVASKEGWHKKLDYANESLTDKYTMGNNAHVGYDENGEFGNAVLDFPLMAILNKSSIKNEVKGTDSYVFDFPNPGNAVSYNPLDFTDLEATQFFYSSNYIHDVLYHHGFNPEAGSFQANEGEGHNLIGFTTSGLGKDEESTNTNNAFMVYSSYLIPNPTAVFLTMKTINSDAGVLTVNNGSLQGNYKGAIGNNNFSYTTSSATANIVLAKDDAGDDPNDACEPITNGAELTGKIAAVNRGTCSFANKVDAIKEFNPVGIVIFNNVETDITNTIDIANPDLNIPVVAINKPISDNIKQSLQNNQTIEVRLPANDFGISTKSSGLDSQIILHEYTHAVSKRLMNDAQSGEEQMGEGWSDYFAINLTQQPGQLSTDQLLMGAYAFGGRGIRALPYTTDTNINPHTYDFLKSIGDGEQPHATGYLWALMLWEMHWNLVNKYGFNPDNKSDTGGNNIALRLVIHGMKIGPANPGFVDGRNAILEADKVLYNGENLCQIWSGFAKRGLGYSADQGSSASRTDGTEAFDMPPVSELDCTMSNNDLIKTDLTIYPNPAKDEVYITSDSKVSKAELIDVTGRVVSVQDIQSNNKPKVDTSKLTKGVYILKLHTDKGVVTKKVIKN